VNTLTEQERQDALLVFRHVHESEPLPLQLIERIGPPLVHPDDPRLVYEARENLRMDRIVREGADLDGAQSQYLYGEKERNDDLRLAAESPEEYGDEPKPEDDPTN